jgi:hypothetical protein
MATLRSLIISNLHSLSWFVIYAQLLFGVFTCKLIVFEFALINIRSSFATLHAWCALHLNQRLDNNWYFCEVTEKWTTPCMLWICVQSMQYLAVLIWRTIVIYPKKGTTIVEHKWILLFFIKSLQNLTISRMINQFKTIIQVTTICC